MKVVTAAALAATVVAGALASTSTSSEAKGLKLGAAAGFMIGKSAGKAYARSRNNGGNHEDDDEAAAERAQLRAERLRAKYAEHEKAQAAGSAATENQPTIGAAVMVAPPVKAASAEQNAKAVCIAGCD